MPYKPFDYYANIVFSNTHNFHWIKLYVYDKQSFMMFFRLKFSY